MTRSVVGRMVLALWVSAHAALYAVYLDARVEPSRHAAPIPDLALAEWTPRQETGLAELRLELLEAPVADRALDMDGPNSGLSLVLPIRRAAPRGTVREDWVPPRLRGASQAAEL